MEQGEVLQIYSRPTFSSVPKDYKLGVFPLKQNSNNNTNRDRTSEMD